MRPKSFWAGAIFFSAEIPEPAKRPSRHSLKKQIKFCRGFWCEGTLWTKSSKDNHSRHSPFTEDFDTSTHNGTKNLSCADATNSKSHYQYQWDVYYLETPKTIRLKQFTFNCTEIHHETHKVHKNTAKARHTRASLSYYTLKENF